MDANSWALIVAVALMALCCLSMLFMRRHDGYGRHPDREIKNKSDKRVP